MEVMRGMGLMVPLRLPNKARVTKPQQERSFNPNAEVLTHSVASVPALFQSSDFGFNIRDRKDRKDWKSKNFLRSLCSLRLSFPGFDQREVERLSIGLAEFERAINPLHSRVAHFLRGLRADAQLA